MVGWYVGIIPCDGIKASSSRDFAIPFILEKEQMSAALSHCSYTALTHRGAGTVAGCLARLLMHDEEETSLPE